MEPPTHQKNSTIHNIFKCVYITSIKIFRMVKSIPPPNAIRTDGYFGIIYFNYQENLPSLSFESLSILVLTLFCRGNHMARNNSMGIY